MQSLLGTSTSVWADSWCHVHKISCRRWFWCPFAGKKSLGGCFGTFFTRFERLLIDQNALCAFGKSVVFENFNTRIFAAEMGTFCASREVIKIDLTTTSTDVPLGRFLPNPQNRQKMFANIDSRAYRAGPELSMMIAKVIRQDF